MPSSILDIPNELLGEVFAHVPRSLESHLSDINRLTLVCKLWREVVISTPSLWCNIPLACPRRTSLYLQRSKDALLDVHCNLNSSIDAIQLALTELRRMKILHLKVDQYSFHAIMQALSNDADTPSGHFLEHLSVQRLRSFISPDLQLVSSLPSHFLCDRLVSLKLENVDMPTKLPVLGSLVRLALDYPPLRQTWSEFADIFTATPALRTLALQGRFSPVSHDFTPRNADTIRLPHLSEFRLDGVHPPAHCAAMLDQMEYPSALHPRITMPAIPGLDFAPLFKHCAYLGTQSHSDSEHGLSTSLMLTYTGDYLAVSLYKKASDPLFRVHGFPKDDDVAGIFESACASLNLAQVRDLSTDLRTTRNFPLGQWLPYSRLTSIQEVHASHRLTEVIELLDFQPPATVPNTQSNAHLTGVVPFPHLESLSFHHCSITNESVERLASIISQRNHLGHRIQQIFIWESLNYSALSRESFSLLQAQSLALLSPYLFSDGFNNGSAPPSGSSANILSPGELPALSPDPTMESSESTPLPSEATPSRSSSLSTISLSQSSVASQSHDESAFLESANVSLTLDTSPAQSPSPSIASFDQSPVEPRMPQRSVSYQVDSPTPSIGDVFPADLLFSIIVVLLAQWLLSFLV